MPTSETGSTQQVSSPLTIDSTSEESDSFSTVTPVSRSPTALKFGVPIRQQTTGNSFGQRTPLAPSYTGGMFARSGAVGRTPNAFGSSPTCPRCSKAVYFAEQVCFCPPGHKNRCKPLRSGQRRWEEVAQGSCNPYSQFPVADRLQACLTCSACRKRLDSFNLQEHDEEPYW